MPDRPLARTLGYHRPDGDRPPTSRAPDLVTAARYAAQACGVGLDDDHEFDLYPAELSKHLGRCELDPMDWEASLDSIAQSIDRAGLSTSSRSLSDMPIVDAKSG